MDFDPSWLLAHSHLYNQVTSTFSWDFFRLIHWLVHSGKSSWCLSGDRCCYQPAAITMKRVLSVGDISSVEQCQDDGGQFTQVTTRGKGKNNKKSRLNTDTGTTYRSASTSSASDEVQSLKAEIVGLKETIKQLSGQLSFVLSYLGLSGHKVTDATEVNSGRSLSEFPPLFLSQSSTPVASTSSIATSTVVGSNYSTVPVAFTVPTLRNHRKGVALKI